MLPNDIYHTFRKVGDKFNRAGRFFIHDGVLHHLEDYHDGLQQKEIPGGPVDDVTVMKMTNPHGPLRVVSDASWRAGDHHDLIPTAQLQPLPQHMVNPPTTEQKLAAPPRPPSIWHYQRVGHDAAHTLEHVGGGKYTLDGNPLQDDEMHAIVANIKNKAATLRYKNGGVADAVMKMEQMFSTLRKADDDMDPDAALAHLDKVHAGGDPDTLKAIASLRRRVFEDPMNPGLGNKLAYEQFRKKNAPGVWASLDLNDFKHANDTYGHDVGDDLIRATGRAVRESVDPKTAKAFRAGGDEYVMHFPSHEHAAQAMRTLRQKMDEITPVQGAYKPSFSVGLGPSFEHADKALFEAKKQKHTVDPATGLPTRAFAPGQTPHLAHSLVPGFEGPVPLQSEQLPALALPEGAKETPVAPAPEPVKPSAPAPASKTA